MQMNVSTRQLRAFAALARERHFTRAAQSCHLSQPAFSALIRQLEAAVGTRLFERSTRHVQLSPEGEEFLAGAQRVLAELDGALDGLRERVARQRGRAALALLPSLAAGWLPPVLAGFRAAYPGLDTEVHDQLSEPCIERVRSGQADFALATVRADTAELVAEPFCSDAFHLVCPRDHPLATQTRLRPGDVAAHAFIHLARHSSVRQYLEAATHPLTLRPLMEVEQLATVAAMVRAGLGVSIVPALTLYQFQDPALVLRPLAWKGLRRQIYLVRRRDRGLSIAAQALHDWCWEHRPDGLGQATAAVRIR